MLSSPKIIIMTFMEDFNKLKTTIKASIAFAIIAVITSQLNIIINFDKTMELVIKIIENFNMILKKITVSLVE